MQESIIQFATMLAPMVAAIAGALARLTLNMQDLIVVFVLVAEALIHAAVVFRPPIQTRFWSVI